MLFGELVRRRFLGDLQMSDTEMCRYLSALLTEFASTKRLYKIRNKAGERVEDVGAMLAESHPLLEADSFDREREVRKHIGDFTLFFTGVFPEWLNSRKRRRMMPQDAYLDYVQTGKESYAVVAAFDQFEYADEAPLYRRLSERFETCVYGLNLVRQDLDRMGGGARSWTQLMS